MAMVEEYQHATAAGSAGAAKKLNCSPEVYESLEHHLAVAEAAQRLRLPLLSQDGEVHEEEIEKLSTLSRVSFDSTVTSATPSSTSISTNYNNYGSTGSALTAAAAAGGGGSELVEPGAGGVPDRFLGITSDYLYQVQQQQPAMTVDMVEYQRSVARAIEARLEAKCDALADLFAMDERDSSSINQISSARLPERVKLIIEGIEKEESLLLEDLASMDRKFAEHYNDDVKKTWLIKRCRTMNAKLSYLEHHLLRDTYTKETVPALHRIRKYLVEATKEASNSYNEAVSRLREYQGVDPHFDVIARQYHEIVKLFHFRRLLVLSSLLRRSLSRWAAGSARASRFPCRYDKMTLTVAVFAQNVPAMCELHFAVPMAGAVICALNSRLDAAMASVLLRHSEARVLFVDAALLGVAREALRLLSDAGATPPAVVLIRELLDGCDDGSTSSFSGATGTVYEYEALELPKTATGKVQKFALRDKAKAMGSLSTSKL
ncbi:unnamed protein product [Triticum turgidum subsp. durum]|uniref:AMP-dependent synthetase/ligase domain-containing protein n=1 Tax=Triticum turgidum subsp. durum TaxID=4567 RepID=A0A9R0YF77_TRITD|nr:unnamed protein product [Triticum turgidum subsp. durum]